MRVMMSVENARRAWTFMKVGLVAGILVVYCYHALIILFVNSAFLKRCNLRAKRLETALFSERIDAQVVDCQEESYLFFLKSRVLTIRYQFREHEIVKRFKCTHQLNWKIGESLSEEDRCLFDPSNPLSAIPYEIFDMYAKYPFQPLWIHCLVYVAPCMILAAFQGMYRKILVDEDGLLKYIHVDITFALLGAGMLSCVFHYLFKRKHPPEEYPLKVGSGKAFRTVMELVSVSATAAKASKEV